jgi:uncharacterized membrane protein
VEEGRSRIRPRCTWTGRHSDEVKEIRVETLDRWGIHTREETFGVLPEHEEELRRFVTYQRRFGRLFLLLMVLGTAVVIFVRSNVGVGLTMIGLGVVTFAFPFATPETVQMIGMRKSIRSVRYLSILPILIGVAFLLGGL